MVWQLSGGRTPPSSRHLPLGSAHVQIDMSPGLRRRGSDATKLATNDNVFDKRVFYSRSSGDVNADHVSRARDGTGRP